MSDNTIDRLTNGKASAWPYDGTESALSEAAIDIAVELDGLADLVDKLENRLLILVPQNLQPTAGKSETEGTEGMHAPQPSRGPVVGYYAAMRYRVSRVNSRLSKLLDDLEL